MARLLVRYLKIVGLTFLGLGCILALAAWWQWDTLKGDFEQWKSDYQKTALEKAIQTEVAHLGPVDEVEVILLSEDPKSSGQKPFHKSVERDVVTYEEKKVILKGADALALASLWRSQTVDRNGVNCHAPHYALRFLNHGKEVSRAIICFHCQNAEIPSSFFGGDLIVIDTTTPAYRELKAQILQQVGGGEIAKVSSPR